MHIDLDLYLINKPFVQYWYETNADKSINGAVSILAASTGCPCIALAFYLSEDLGFTPTLIHLINSLIEFYGYKEIAGQPNNSPYLDLDPNRDIMK